MDLTLITQNTNKLLSRTEVKAKVTFEGTTPARKQIQAEIAKQLKAKPENVLIISTKTAFGESSAKISAHVYNDEKVMMSLERKNLVEKHTGHEPKQEEEEAN